MTPEEQEEAWREEEPYSEAQPAADPVEEQKRQEAEAKLIQEQTDETQAVAKRKGYKMFIHGDGFCQNDKLKV